jgi:hypothetical protein
MKNCSINTLKQSTPKKQESASNKFKTNPINPINSISSRKSSAQEEPKLHFAVDFCCAQRRKEEQKRFLLIPLRTLRTNSYFGFYLNALLNFERF